MPEELVEKAAAAGLEAVALTDHDTVGGIDRFMAACNKCDGDKAAQSNMAKSIELSSSHFL